MDSDGCIAADDWTDQDLLTRSEARARLGDEIDEEREALTKLSETDADPRVRSEIQFRTRRLTALRAARAEM
jgi:hypothetical protein